MTFSPLGGVAPLFYMGILKGRPDVILVVNCKFCSISHRFRVISDCLETGNDVISFTPPGGVAPQFYLGILNGRPRLTISG